MLLVLLIALLQGWDAVVSAEEPRINIVIMLYLHIVSAAKIGWEMWPVIADPGQCDQTVM